MTKRKTGAAHVVDTSGKVVQLQTNPPATRVAAPLRNAAQPPSKRRITSSVITSPDRGGLATGYVDLIKKAADVSQTISDPFDGMYDGLSILDRSAKLKVLEPFYPFEKLQGLFLSSSVLRQCVEAYVNNIDGFGSILEYIGPEGSEDSSVARDEKAFLEVLLRKPNPEHNLIQTRKQLRTDKHVYGNAALEVIRNRLGQITYMKSVPQFTMRMTDTDPELVKVTVKVRTTTGRVATVTQGRRFRRYVQKLGGNKYVYFKEFGDPRVIDSRTGLVNPSTPDQFRATEIKMFANYTPGMGYGTPLWVSTMTDILGHRESSLVNLNFFRDNAIPAMAVLVSGGFLAEEAVLSLKQRFENVRGRDAANNVMVLEALAEETGDANKTNPAPRVEMKSLVSERQQDGLFLEYQKAAKNMVRSSMRLPALYTGDTDEYTKATAITSVLVAETQVFAPERNDFDAFMNEEVLTTYDIANWRFKSLAPKLGDPDQVAKLLDSLDKIGALTPNVGIKLANELLSLSIEKVTAPWGDYPFEMIRDIIRTGYAAKGMEDVIGEQYVQPSAPAATGNTPDKDNGGSLTKTMHRIAKALEERINE